MDVVEIVVQWAKKHKEIVAVILGGSRAKGTASVGSDHDFGVQLEQDPTPGLIQVLTRDFPLKSCSEARSFSLLNIFFKSLKRAVQHNQQKD